MKNLSAKGKNGNKNEKTSIKDINMERELNIRILLIPEKGNGWSAVCLEYDIASQGITQEHALDSLLSVMFTQIYIDVYNNNELFKGYKQSPPEYRKDFYKSKQESPNMRMGISRSSLVANDYNVTITSRNIRIKECSLITTSDLKFLLNLGNNWFRHGKPERDTGELSYLTLSYEKDLEIYDKLKEIEHELD